MFYIIGLGNPGEEYHESRHNTGRMAVEFFGEKLKVKNVKVIQSNEFMNNSGKAVAKYFKSNLPTGRQEKAAENLIVVYDDIDLALGKIKISWNKSSGGHRGLESVIKALKTKEFTRVRIGIAPTTLSGKIKKPGRNLPAPARPAGGGRQEKVLDFILGKFKPSELLVLKKSFKLASEAISTIIEEGREKAMNLYN